MLFAMRHSNVVLRVVVKVYRILFVATRQSFVFALAAISLLAAIRLVGMQDSGQDPSTAEMRRIQQQYQKLIQDLYAEEAKIQQRRASYGKKSIDDIQDTVKDLIGIIKDTPPNEDSGESLFHYVEYLMKLRDLVNTASKQLDGIADSKTSLIEKDLLLQKLNDRFVKANNAARALAEVSKAVRNPAVNLQEIPYHQKDWTDLDQAVDQMKREELSALPKNPPLTGQGYERERKKYLVAHNAASQALQSCLKKIPICFDSCVAGGDTSTPGKWLARETQCEQQCGSCKAEEAADLTAQQALLDFEKANNYGYAKRQDR